MSMPRVSVIVPTVNEAENLPLLLPQIAAALSGRAYEVLIVDDASRDNTADVCARLARDYPLKLLVRANPTNGLSGAVLHGMTQAAGDLLVVMDADLQHPPERLQALLDPLEKGEADFVIGSRYISGGEMAQRFGIWRRLLSRAATMLARPIVGDVQDPMSGFFALRRACYLQGRRLTPLGYKIALELICKCPVPRVREVPIFFGARMHGRSKLTLREQFRYLEHLSRLYDFRYPRASPIAKFLIALACSWIAGALASAALVLRGLGLAAGVMVSYPAAVLVTAVFHVRYCRTQREFLVRAHPWRDFTLISLAEWASCAAAASWLAARLAAPRAAEVFLLSYSLAAVVRYALRKELLMDIRGLRKDVRADEMTP